MGAIPSGAAAGFSPSLSMLSAHSQNRRAISNLSGSVPS